MLINLDLHSHSTCSDGALSPQDLVARAAQRGVSVLALTDHDLTDGLAAARLAAQRHRIRFIDGVEISVTWHGKTVHIVGLGIAPDEPALQAGLAATRSGRIERACKIAAAFAKLGFAGTFEGAQRYVVNPAMIGRTHFARHLVSQRIVKDTNSAFKRFLGDGESCYVPHQWASLSDAVHWINASGGIAVVAHPGRYPFETAQMRELLLEFRDLGGTAIEVVSGRHQPHHRALFAAYAREFGFAASIGSDFHGPGESNHDLGSLAAIPAGLATVWELLCVNC